MYEETGKWLNKMYSTDSFCISFECGEDTEETLEFFKKSTENSFSKNGFVDSKTEADGFSMGTGASWAEVVVYVLAASGFVKSVDEAIEVIKKQGKSLIDFSKSLLGTKKEQEDLLLEDKSEDIQATPEDGRYSLGILKILCLAHLSGKFGEQTKPSTKYIRSNVVYKRDIDLSYMVVNPIYIMIPDDTMNCIHFYSALTDGTVEYLFKENLEHNLSEGDYNVEEYEENGVIPGYLDSVPMYYGADFKHFSVGDKVFLRKEGSVTFGTVEFSDEEKLSCLIKWDGGNKTIEVYDDIDLVRD